VAVAALTVALPASASALIHSGPYTLPPSVTTPRHGTAYEPVSVPGRYLNCAGDGTVSYTSLVAANRDGSKARAASAVPSHGGWTFRLPFTRADRGTWKVAGFRWACSGDGVVRGYEKQHPAFTVR
jgi:hypothetical protein